VIAVPDLPKWFLLAYKVPREPTSSRVYVWRKLKKLGAVALQDAVWLLPASPQTREQFQWLAAEITELGGEATLWESNLVQGSADGSLERRFEDLVETPYKEILAALKRRKPDLAALSRRYQQTLAQDYFKSELGQKVRKALLSATGEQER
jgi:hypothetical protein